MGSIFISEMFDFWQSVIILELLPVFEGFFKRSVRPAHLNLSFDCRVHQQFKSTGDMHIVLPRRGINSTDEQNEPGEQAIANHHGGLGGIDF